MYQKLTLPEITNDLRNESSYMIIPFRKVLHEKYPSIFCDYECEINEEALPRVLERLKKYAISKDYDRAFVNYFLFPDFPETAMAIYNFRLSQEDLSSLGILDEFIFLNDLFSAYEFDEKEKTYFLRLQFFSEIRRPCVKVEEKDDQSAYEQIKSSIEDYMSLSLEEEAAKRRNEKNVFEPLTEREKTLFSYRCGLGGNHEPMNREQVGKRFGVTEKRIRQIENRAIRKMRAILIHGLPCSDKKLDKEALKKIFQNYNEDKSLISNEKIDFNMECDEIPYYEIDDVINVALNRLSSVERAILSYRYGLNNKDPLSIEELSSLFSFSLEETRDALKNALLHLQTPDAVKALKKAEVWLVKRYQNDDVISYIDEDKTKTPINKILLAKIIAPLESISIEEDGRIAIYKGGSEC